MPTYEYECQKCGKHFDRFQGMSDAPIKRCPSCKGSVRRLLGSGAGIIFKGSGFYETDYKRKGSSESSSSSSSPKKPKSEGGTKDSSAPASPPVGGSKSTTTAKE